jgi:Zn-dependent peptidase ImmA (M78 family)/transcriptional regulator with XRE-family HTH domain
VPMGSAVPVTPAVIKWSLDESGYTLKAVAQAIRVPYENLRAWTTGESSPKLTELRAFAQWLNRPLATFLLPAPPPSSLPAVKFRSVPRSENRAPYPGERLRLREAGRLQTVLSWINRELQRSPIDLPRLRITADPKAAAEATRIRLGITHELQLSWRSPSAALEGWRSALEDSGVFVLMLPLGEELCRGFSLWEEHAPLVAANTAWNTEARIFTLFHEYGHLLTRTSSACVEGSARRTVANDDPAERWCERFASAVIIPPADLQVYLVHRGLSGSPITDLSEVRRIASTFKASLRATALALIEAGAASRKLYSTLPPMPDRKADGGGGAGRNRAQIKRDQYGNRALNVFAEALQEDVVSRSDVLDYLDIAPEALVQSGSSAERD